MNSPNWLALQTTGSRKPEAKKRGGEPIGGGVLLRYLSGASWCADARQEGRFRRPSKSSYRMAAKKGEGNAAQQVRQ